MQSCKSKIFFVVVYGDQLKYLVRNIFDELFNSVVNVTILLQWFYQLWSWFACTFDSVENVHRFSCCNLKMQKYSLVNCQEYESIMWFYKMVRRRWSKFSPYSRTPELKEELKWSQLRIKYKSKKKSEYCISSYSCRGNYSFLNLEFQRSQYIRPKVT